VRMFEREMSPASLFDRLPLARCLPSTREWLGDLVHNLWLTRYAVHQRMADALAILEEANGVYHQLGERLRACAVAEDVKMVRSWSQDWLSFREACQKLARAIETFPSEVRV